MKQTYSLIAALLIAVIAFAQQPIITAIVDGDCGGGTPKLMEIYAQGTVDFSQYSIQNQSNANTGTFGSTTSLASFGTVTNGFVYVTSTKGSNTAGMQNLAALASEFPSLNIATILESSATANNGDDRVRIINSSTMAVVDQYGVSGIDGTGEVWEYEDSYAKRKNGQGPSTTFDPAQWTYGGKGFLDGKGTCQGGADTYATLIGGVATYTAVASTAPSLTITSPANNSTLDNGSLTATLSVTNFNIAAMNAGDGYIVYQLDTDAAVNKFDTAPITISGIAPGAHSLVVKLVNNAGADLSPAVFQTLNFTVPSQVAVNTIATLRNQNVGGSTIYTLTSQAVITMTQSFRNQKWIEDATGAIVIDDTNGAITTALTRGDAITGLTGTLSEFNGLLQFIPTTDTGAATSGGNIITPQTVSLAMLNANPEAYESELVTVTGSQFTTADGSIVFENNVDLPLGNATDTFNHENFFSVDYTGQVVPTVVVSITGVIRQDNTGYSLSARDLADIQQSTASTTDVALVDFSIYPNPATSGILNINSTTGSSVDIAIFSTLGQQVMTQKSVAKSMNISSLSTGLYIVKITQGVTTLTKKLVVN